MTSEEAQALLVKNNHFFYEDGKNIVTINGKKTVVTTGTRQINRENIKDGEPLEYEPIVYLDGKITSLSKYLKLIGKGESEDNIR